MSDIDDQRPSFVKREREISDLELDQVRQSLKGLSFGTVSIVIQDGVIVQIDRTEKRRLRIADSNSTTQQRR